MSPAQQPRLLWSGLTGRVYVVTRYRDLGEGRIEAVTKFDVTADFEAIRAALAAPVPDGANG